VHCAAHVVENINAHKMDVENFEGEGKLEERNLQNIITTCNKEDGLDLSSSWQEQMVGYIKHVKESLVPINQNNFHTK